MNDQAKTWHKENKMSKNPSLDEKIKWAIVHAEKCGCRPIPENLLAEIKKRNIKV